jgi:hypothetical protein
VREEESLVVVLAIYLAYRLGRWVGRRAERQDLLRTISALRIIQHKEQ